MLTLAASAALAVLTLSSCATINSGADLAGKGAIGQAIGEANSTYILGLWSINGKNNNIREAAKNGGIQNVTQVEYIDKSIFFGLVVKHTTRVYGD